MGAGKPTKAWAWWITGHHLSSSQWYDIVRSTIGSVGVFGVGAVG